MNPLFANQVLHDICLILALLLFLVAAFNWEYVMARTQIGWWGLFFLALALLVF
jgi:hypothetical protein